MIHFQARSPRLRGRLEKAKSLSNELKSEIGKDGFPFDFLFSAQYLQIWSVIKLWNNNSRRPATDIVVIIETGFPLNATFDPQFPTNAGDQTITHSSAFELHILAENK